MKTRVFNGMQYLYNPKTGEQLFSINQVMDGFQHRTIKRWAYVLHDKDIKEDGTPKEPHIHFVGEMGTNQVDTSTIAKWFGVPENFINVAKGRGAFLDCVQYLTHEDAKQQELGKTLYADDCIKANFDFRKCLDNYMAQKAKYGRGLSEKDTLRSRVLYDGLSLKQAMEENPILYQNDMMTLHRMRLEYLCRVKEVPEMRLNFYVEGKGGIGKGLISKAIAKILVDPDDQMDDDEVYFSVGAENVTFEGYDGQPVIIWDDCRAFTLLQKLKSRETVFNVFDPYPQNIKVNIKNSSVKLCNRINIVNSVQSWKEFLDGLAGEYIDSSGERRTAEDRSQSYRRFPFFIVLHEKDYELGVNKGFMENTRNFFQYYRYMKVVADFPEIKREAGKRPELENELYKKALSPVMDEYKKAMSNKLEEAAKSDDEILAKHKDDGQYSSVDAISAE